MSKYIAYSNELNKTISSKIYFKADLKITELDLTKYYKIKDCYMSPRNAKMLDLFLGPLVPIALKELISKFVHDTYYQPDEVIYRELEILITSAMPDLNEKLYISNIQAYVETAQ